MENAELIAILREPVARAYSAYWFRRGLGGETQSFEEAIEREQQPGFVPKPRLPLLLEASFYLPALERVCRYYPRDRLLVLAPETVVHTGHGDDTSIGDEAPHLDEWVARGG